MTTTTTTLSTRAQEELAWITSTMESLRAELARINPRLVGSEWHTDRVDELHYLNRRRRELTGE